MARPSFWGFRKQFVRPARQVARDELGGMLARPVEGHAAIAGWSWRPWCTARRRPANQIMEAAEAIWRHAARRPAGQGGPGHDQCQDRRHFRGLCVPGPDRPAGAARDRAFAAHGQHADRHSGARPAPRWRSGTPRRQPCSPPDRICHRAISTRFSRRRRPALR